MTGVGERPRHRAAGPSLLATLRRPSRVEVNVLLRVSSTAQSAAAVFEGDTRAELRLVDVEADPEPGVAKLGVAAIQKGEVLFTQKTSRQQAVTPRFGGRFAKLAREAEGFGGGCDWSLTRTTSRGVTAKELLAICDCGRWCKKFSTEQRCKETARNSGQHLLSRRNLGLIIWPILFSGHRLL